MIIHIVKPGETLASIAEHYHVSIERLAIDNHLTNPNRLVVDQTLLILYPEQIHTVQEGETLLDIANQFNVNPMQILRNNPFLGAQESLYTGQEIIISYKNSPNQGPSPTPLRTTGYTMPFINNNILRKTLPYLTYLTVFGHRILSDGTLNQVNDSYIIETAKAYNTSPIMLISPLSISGEIYIDPLHDILNNPESHHTFIYNIIDQLKLKGYEGVNLDFQYILPEDYVLFNNFMKQIIPEIQKNGLLVFVTLSPDENMMRNPGFPDEIDVEGIGNLADGVTLVHYDWCRKETFPTGLLPLSVHEEYISYILRTISVDKLIVGISVLGYIWELPYVEDSVGNAISYSNVLALAWDTNSTIQFDTSSSTPYFTFYNHGEYFVWFRDLRSIAAYGRIVNQLGLKEAAYWNIMLYLPQVWLMVNYLYDIQKRP